MNLGSQFLEAIRSAPHDEAIKLVFADWLDDQGDPLGELIRVEVERRGLMREDKGGVSKYAALTRRSNQLRRDIGLPPRVETCSVCRGGWMTNGERCTRSKFCLGYTIRPLEEVLCSLEFGC